MPKAPKSTIFKFILDSEQLFSNLDHLKLHNYQRFLKIGQVGKQIQALSKADDYKELEQLCDKNFMDLQFMKMQIQDAFISALHLRNQATVQYYLRNGMELDRVQPGCIVEVCYSLQYLKNDPPTDLLKLLLEYGGNPRHPSQQNSDTAMHIVARYGNIDFLKLLLEYGADINGVNDDKKTPLGCAIETKQKAAIQFLKSKNANQKWND